MRAKRPLILYVPGLKPKPEPEAHRDQLYRCLLTGLRYHDPEIASSLENGGHSFDLISWTYDFYGEHRDVSLDMPGIDALLAQQQAQPIDIAEATSFRRRMLRAVYSAADHLPFLIPHFADKDIEIQLSDFRRYVRNDFEIADLVRRMLKMPLRAAMKAGRPVLLIGHSMGSVIAYDSLWQLSQDSRRVGVDTLMTLGSPLGQRLIQSKLLGANRLGSVRYPSNISHWINLSAVGELTAIDMKLKNDFGEMQDLGLLESFADHEVHNWFRLNGELNVHAEYGYLANPVTASIVSDWLRRSWDSA
jgi:hypothetical protein